MKIDIIDSFGDVINVEPELGLYKTHDFMGVKMPGLAIQLYSYDEDGIREPYSNLTVNFGEFLSMKNCAYIDENNNSFTSQFLNKGICIDTGITKHSGYCDYALWRFDEAFLKAIDVHGLYDTYSSMFDRYIQHGGLLSAIDREDVVLLDVAGALNCDNFRIVDKSNNITVVINGKTLADSEIYQYLLDNVCKFNKDGSIEGLDLEQNVDFKDLCEHRGVDYISYSQKGADDLINEAKANDMVNGGNNIVVRDIKIIDYLKENKSTFPSGFIIELKDLIDERSVYAGNYEGLLEILDREGMEHVKDAHFIAEDMHNNQNRLQLYYVKNIKEYDDFDLRQLAAKTKHLENKVSLASKIADATERSNNSSPKGFDKQRAIEGREI